VFRNCDCLSLFVSSNTTLLELQTLLFFFGGAAYLRMRLIHGRLRYSSLSTLKKPSILLNGLLLKKLSLILVLALL